jgi:nucleoside-diphosphate-sugar epimerase
VPIATVLGGSGLVGSAVALSLAHAGWEVVAAGRAAARFPQRLRDAGVRFIESDRYATGDLRALLSNGADVVVDCLGYTADHARMLLPYQRSIGSLIFVSSKATMAPSDIDYNSREGYGANKVAAEDVLLDSAMAVSVLRPSRIHGVGGTRPREWVFVKRVLDARPVVVLAAGGRGVNHPTAAVNLAALAEFCASRPAKRILNSADPDAPDGLAISRIIAAHLGHTWREALLGPSAPDGLGDHPWNTLPPFILDTSAAERLGFTPVGSYAETVGAEVDWLVGAARSGDPGGVLPRLDDPYFQPFFDYARENAWLEQAARTSET